MSCGCQESGGGAKAAIRASIYRGIGFAIGAGLVALALKQLGVKVPS